MDDMTPGYWPSEEELEAEAERLLEQAHALGLSVIPWTINEPEAMVRAMQLGVDGIITDYPDRLRALLIERGEPVPPRYPE